MNTPQLPARRGPKLKIGPEEEARIFAILSVGGSLRDCADLVGVDFTTLWRKRRADRKFARGVIQASAKGKIYLLRKIFNSRDWRAHAWFLERKWPREHGRHSRAAVEHVMTFAKVELAETITGTTPGGRQGVTN